MIKAFTKFVGGEDGEEKAILLLLGMGFFMGIYTASYEVAAKALFINTLGEQYLDKAFFAAGLMGILSTILFTYVQKRTNFSTLALTNIFLIFVFMGLLRYAFSFDAESLPYFELLPFLLFVMIGPIAAIQYLTFWGLFGRMFNLKQNKRIVGGIDTGQLTATILAFFSIPLLVNFVIDETYDLLFIAAISSFGIFVFVFWIVSTFNVDAATKPSVLAGETEANIKEEDISYVKLWKNPFYRWMSLFLIASMGASVFVDYTFYIAAETMYPDEKDLASFLGFFEAITMIFVFIFQSFFNDRIIEDYGLKFSLRVMPIILLFFTIGIIFTGHIYGYETKTDEYLLFFIFNVMAKLFTSSIKDSLENPAFKLFFLPLSARIRFSAQNMIEGVVNQGAILLAGALQLGLGFLVFIKLIHYSYFVLALAITVIYFAGRVFNEYLKTLKSSLEENKKLLAQQGISEKNEDTSINTIIDEIKTTDQNRVLIALKMIEMVDPLQLEFTLLDQLKSRFKQVRIFAFRKLEEKLMISSLSIIERAAKNEKDEDVKKVANICVKRLQEVADFELTFNTIRPYVRSTNADERLYAARVLAKMEDDQLVPFLKELMRDVNSKVRVAALISAGKTKIPEFWPVLVENLHLAPYENAAASALAVNGETVFPTLDAAFYKTNQYFDTMDRIIQIYGKVAGRLAVELLWKKIEYPDRKIVSEILLSLSYIGFEAKDFQAAKIKLSIENNIGDIAWNLKTMNEIPRETDLDEILLEALKEENEKNYQDIFMFLSMVFDPQNIALVKENIKVGSSESITFAVEMVNIFIDEELKKKLVPLLDDLTVEQKLTRLHNYFPPEHFASYDDLLLQIVNRDYNHINRWTKALALWRLGDIENIEISYDLIANLFNPDPFLKQTAAYIMYKIDKSAYHNHTKRLKPYVKKELDRVILPPIFAMDDDDFHHKQIGIEKAIFLKSILSLSSISGNIITELADNFDELKVKAGQAIISPVQESKPPLYIVFSGKVQMVTSEGSETLLQSKTIFGEKYIVDADKVENTYIAKEDCILLYITKDQLFNQMSKHLQVAEAFIKIINDDLTEEVVHEEVFDSIFA